MPETVYVLQNSTFLALFALEKLAGGAKGAAEPSNVARVVYTITDLQTGLGVPGHDGVALNPAEVVLAEPIEVGDDARWLKHATLNFVHELGPTALPNAPRDYRYEATVTGLGGQVVQLVQQLATIPVFGVGVAPPPPPVIEPDPDEPDEPTPTPDPDLTPPTADIVNVVPDPRTTAVGSILIVFSEAVSGFGVGDLTLKRDGGANLLTGSQTLTTSDGVTWTLGNLAGLTAELGNYVLTLVAAGSGIVDGAGNPLASNATDSWTMQAPAGPISPPETFGFPNTDANLRVLSGTHKSFSATFGVVPASWRMAFHFGLFVVWKGGGADPLIRPPQNSAELYSGQSTGPGTYTLQQGWDYAANRYRASYPDAWIGLYISGGYVWAPEWIYQREEFSSVYPQAHVLWDEIFGFDGAASGWGITSGSVAIASVSNNAGNLQLNLATPCCLPQWSILKISGASNATYNRVANVREGTPITGGGTTSTIVTDIPWAGGSSGGSIQGGARKVVRFTDPAWWANFSAKVLELVDRHRARHAINSIWFDEQSHEQSNEFSGTGTWAQKAVGWEGVKQSLHARGLPVLGNMTWHLISKCYVLSSFNSGGKVAFLLRNRITLSAGQQVAVSGHSVGGYNGVHTVANYVGRQVFTNTAWSSAGTGGTLNNNGIAEQLGTARQAFDGFSFEGTWMIELRTQSITEQFVANLRALWNAGFTIVDIAQANQQTYTILNSRNLGGLTEFTTAEAVGLPIGARIGVWGHSLGSLSAIHYVRDVGTSGPGSFLTDTAYVGSAGSGGGLVYSNLGRLIAIDAINNGGPGGRQRVHCASDHHIFPLEHPSEAIRFYGSLYAALSGAYTPLEAAGQPAKFDFADTATVSITGRGYAVDVQGQRRFWAAFLCCIREPGDRGGESQDVSVGTPVWNSWPQRLGAALGPAAYTYAGGGQDARCSLITRSFTNGTVSVYPQLGYATVVINGIAE